MAQLIFDHSFNTPADTACTNRYQQKMSRQWKSRSGEYQVNANVWAIHPKYQFMYIASITAVNRSRRTCQVTFVNDGQTFNLSISHLRHLTRKDIECNRCVDYGRSWSERTSMGAINTYDRYGELQRTQFMGTSEYVSDYFDTVEEDSCVNIDATDVMLSLNDANEDKCKVQEAKDETFWIEIPDPEEPTATYSVCPITNASSYAEAQKKAFELCTQDIEYQKGKQRAQSRIESSQQVIALHGPVLNGSEFDEIWPQTASRSIQLDSPPPYYGSSISWNKSFLDCIELPLDSDKIEGSQKHVSVNPEEAQTPSNSIDDDKERTQAFQRLLPMLTEEIHTSQLLKIWPELNIHLIEQSSRQSSFTESNTSTDDSTPVVNKQPSLSHKMKENLSGIHCQAIEFSHPFLVVNHSQIDKSPEEFFDGRLIPDQTRVVKHQASVVPMASMKIPVSKETGTQTEPYISSSMSNVDQRCRPIHITDSNQSTKSVFTSTTGKKKRTTTWPSKYSSQKQENISSPISSIIEKQYKSLSRSCFDKSFIYAFTKITPLILLTGMVIYYLSTGSTIDDKNVNSLMLTTQLAAPIDIIRNNMVLFFITIMLPSFTISNEVAKSSFKLWLYPFAVS